MEIALLAPLIILAMLIPGAVSDWKKRTVSADFCYMVLMVGILLFVVQIMEYDIWKSVAFVAPISAFLFIAGKKGLFGDGDGYVCAGTILACTAPFIFMETGILVFLLSGLTVAACTIIKCVKRNRSDWKGFQSIIKCKKLEGDHALCEVGEYGQPGMPLITIITIWLGILTAASILMASGIIIL